MPPPLDLVLAADWVSPSIARDKVRRWLRANGWTPPQMDDIVLAINEAVSNSIEHGYGIGAEDPAGAGTVELRGEIADHHVTFTVRDKGVWRPPVDDPKSTRGQGLRLMRACVDQVTIDATDEGTTVVLRGRPLQDGQDPSSAEDRSE
ncbi:ATP-binding protein [Actinophytocola algeriensis]|uniref:Anti-sigma regulatory factor (Ser/Thr protein kinase) n=1 Tax=Actinophytocola algeriensis TaxID=1768010 RepID=A0A7W7VHE4_9PSEU|nr:ATP-binding protein [Actinophytocola algeriensis]MBB4910124.1 anti-sigma regulatory factor (Ser/Thr protein kinase) [Actinophytocola algeriensis]MBE1480888.1 anti-sigma regulatory factor (Ser/Thr protein kinase) [Actinophytocola algeriensis]